MDAKSYPRRSPRLEPLFASIRPFYFVTFNTYKRRPFLARRDVHEAFRSYCWHAENYDVAVGRYVIMPDHIHLFVVLPETGTTLRKWVQMLRTVIGKGLLRSAVAKPHWQEGFFDHVLRSSEGYSQKWDYVRMNPVRAGLCAEPEEWPYQGGDNGDSVLMLGAVAAPLRRGVLARGTRRHSAVATAPGRCLSSTKQDTYNKSSGVPHGCEELSAPATF
jgi:putative transposase